MTVLNMQALKDRAKRTLTGRRESEPVIQRLPVPMTAAQREQVDAIRYFFKTRSREHDSY